MRLHHQPIQATLHHPYCFPTPSSHPSAQMNVEACIALHNALTAHTHPHHRLQRNYFTAYSLSPSSSSPLSSDLLAFLSNIDVPLPPSPHPTFTPFLSLSPPSSLRPQSWLHNEDDYPADEFLLLYTTPDTPCDEPGGLVLSLRTHQVCFVRDAYDDPRERLWGDLHAVLEVYARCVSVGKFVFSLGGDEDREWRWRVEEFTAAELDGALEAWGGFVACVEEKMSSLEAGEREKGEGDGDELEPLVSRTVLDAYPAIPPFARAFLARAKKPRFRYVAPGLRVPDKAFIHRVGRELQERHPAASLTTPRFLLFPWRAPGVPLLSQDDADRWRLPGGRSRILDGRAGLYLDADGIHAHAAILLLPFSIGEKGNVTKGDGFKVERAGQDVLYQHGMCNPFVPGHGTPLAAVLVNWWEQVGNGDWAVDGEGVVGGEELWMRADEEEGAEEFRAEWVCF